METNDNLENPEQEEVVIEDPKAVISALERAKNDAKRYREEKDKLEVDLNSKDQLIAEYSGKLLREKVIQELRANGISDAGRVLRLFDITKLEFDEDFNVVGLNEQLDELKKDLPEIFDAKLRVGGQADAAVKASVSTRYSASEMQAAKILGRS